MLLFTLKYADSGEEVKFEVPEETCHVDQNSVVKSFSAYVGDSQSNEPRYLPYTLSDHRSHSIRDRIKNIFLVAGTAGSTIQGGITGTHHPEAVRLGPGAMRASALRGAAGGFALGVAIRIGVNLVSEALHTPGNKHYYLSPHGPDLEGLAVYKK